MDVFLQSEINENESAVRVLTEITLNYHGISGIISWYFCLKHHQFSTLPTLLRYRLERRSLLHDRREDPEGAPTSKMLIHDASVAGST